MHTIVNVERLSGRIPAPTERGSLHGSLVGFLQRIVTWWERYRQRRALLALDDWALKDIGLSRVDAMHECDKPFWQA